MKLTIRLKILLGFGIVLLLSAAVNIYSLIQIKAVASLTENIYNHPLQVSKAVLTADGDIIRMHRSMKDVALASDEAGVTAASKAVNEYEKEVYDSLTLQMN